MISLYGGEFCYLVMYSGRVGKDPSTIILGTGHKGSRHTKVLACWVAVADLKVTHVGS